ncbi:UNVERIFIED_CONTAM: hypothetical protein K2H54_060286 [Gekko kuhli]
MPSSGTLGGAAHSLCVLASLGGSAAYRQHSRILGHRQGLLRALGGARRQEEEYYNRLEAERRRQHDEAERRLLEPDEPGLYRPPLPREYEFPPLPPSSNAPPPPPQRNTSYLKTQVLSPDTIYTAKFVAYNDEEEEDSCLAAEEIVPLSAAACRAQEF